MTTELGGTRDKHVQEFESRGLPVTYADRVGMPAGDH